MIDRIARADQDAARKHIDWYQAYSDLTAEDSKRRELEEFGFSPAIIEDWKSGGTHRSRLGTAFDSCIVSIVPTMQKIGPHGHMGIGLYLESIRSTLAERFDGGTILDFGCGPWPDISAVLAGQDSKFSVALMDVLPMSLAFASYLLRKRDIRHDEILVTEPGCQLDQIPDDTVMIVESSAFEHVPHIRHLFKPMLSQLPKGGLFLSNYTRVDWTQPTRDGYDECHQYALEAESVAQSLCHRWDWEPAQPGGRGDWDLWERR